MYQIHYYERTLETTLECYFNSQLFFNLKSIKMVKKILNCEAMIHGFWLLKRYWWIHSGPYIFDCIFSIHIIFDQRLYQQFPKSHYVWRFQQTQDNPDILLHFRHLKTIWNEIFFRSWNWFVQRIGILLLF